MPLGNSVDTIDIDDAPILISLDMMMAIIFVGPLCRTIIIAAESQGLTPDEHIPIAHQSLSSPAVAALPGSSGARAPARGLGLARPKGVLYNQTIPRC